MPSLPLAGLSLEGGGSPVRTSRLATLAVTAVILLTGTAAGILHATAGASARSPGRISVADGTPFAGNLTGVTATSASSAWAVGASGSDPLILHWNGTSWVHLHSSAHGRLTGVTATSASSAWAVGRTARAGGKLANPKALILHWNGTSWQTVPNPAPAHSGLQAVSATSASNAWAVGGYGAVSTKILILHWNGKSWTRVPSPAIHSGAQGSEVTLNGVAATSAVSAWAVGAVLDRSSGRDRGLILHWNGTSWMQVNGGSAAAPASFLSGVAAASAGSAWTVGCACGGGPDGGVTGRWNGASWKHVAIPVPALGGSLYAVATAPAGRAWATGVYCAAHCSSRPSVSKVLILHWSGSGWQKVANPAPPGSDLASITAISAISAWAVGTTQAGQALILHWNGHTWS